MDWAVLTDSKGKSTAWVWMKFKVSQGGLENEDSSLIDKRPN